MIYLSGQEAQIIKNILFAPLQRTLQRTEAMHGNETAQIAQQAISKICEGHNDSVDMREWEVIYISLHALISGRGMQTLCEVMYAKGDKELFLEMVSIVKNVFIRIENALIEINSPVIDNTSEWLKEKQTEESRSN